MYSISPRSPFVIIIIKADMNNKMKEIKRDGGNGMKERMNKSADCMGGVMERFIISRDAK